MAVMQAQIANRFGIKVVLIVGFGGLLAIMATAGIYSLRIAGGIQESNRQLRRDYVSRDRTLDEIRSGLYESGNLVRDFILAAPGESGKDGLRVDLEGIQEQMNNALTLYSQYLRPDEVEPFEQLALEMQTYWTALQAIFESKPEAKPERSNRYMRNEVLPRRAKVLEIAREISEVNGRALQDDEKRIADRFAQFRRHLQVMIGIGLCLGLVLAAATVAYAVRLEKVADKRYQEISEAQAELKELSARLLAAHETERKSISRELHDEVGQSLSALLLDIEKLATAPGADGFFRQSLEKTKALVENTVNVVRSISLLLRPSMLDDLGLVAALEWQAREVTKRSGMLVDLVEENVSDALPEEYNTCVYRVVQEALSNCTKHASARTVHIAISQKAQRLQLSIQDDGIGFDSNRVRGLGLVGMSERVAHLSGNFKIDSNKGRGTKLQIELPLTERPAEARQAAR
jgi:signal transduction histidine kinase